MSNTMKLSEELAWRGFVNQTTLDDLKQLDSQPLTFYHGYDASSDSLTIGNLAALMLDKCFIKHGHKAILLAGGATTLVGDPGGKEGERQLQTPKTVKANVVKITQQIERLLGSQVRMVNNLDWYAKLNVLDFLRDVGKHFSMTPLVQRDYIAKRMGADGAGISYAEFSYTLLQGYDYLHLFEAYGVTLQLAGSDQWGNGLSGVDLVRRVKGAEVHVLSCPLVTDKATGKKFGKSEDGAVWLDPAKTSPTQFYQYWINVDDQSVGDYLKIFTEIDRPELERTLAEHAKNPGRRVAQTSLAEAVTSLVHGAKSMEIAKLVTNVIIGKTPINDAGGVLGHLREEIGHAHTTGQGSIIEALVAGGLAASNTEARRFVGDNAISINGQKVSRENFEADDFQNGRLLLRRGKAFKDSALVELS